MSKRLIFLILILMIPSVGLMLRFGIYTMHDFHIFRQFEFDKCVRELTLPCRWAPDSGMGYGEPMFNFYGQFPYWIGEIFHLMGFSILNSVKIIYGLSLFFSALVIFKLARLFWSRNGSFVVALFYVYGPYRAVDVWVRGALNEAWAFVFFPLILYFTNRFIYSRSLRYLFWLILSLTGLVLTHNLSLLMFLPFIGIWTLWTLYIYKGNFSWHTLFDLVSGGLVAILLSAFYLLPVLFESHLVTLSQTITGFYDYRLHFATLNELFITRFWGYGASVWGPKDDMSFSVGHLHWLIPLIMSVYLLIYYRKSKAMVFSFLGLFALFLTHGKSEIIWKLFPPMAYIQFPWRFLTIATLFFSLSIGAITDYLSRFQIVILVGLLISWNVGFFRPDIWRSINDTQQFSGALWDEQRSSALSDYWPKSAEKLPTKFAFINPEIINGEGKIISFDKGSHKINTRLQINSETSQILFPTTYFSGWKAYLNAKEIPIEIFGPLGLISINVPLGNWNADLSFKDTPVRVIGNITTVITLISLILWKSKYAKV